MSGPGSRTRRTAGRRTRFRAWRRGRPFAGGVLLLLAGVVIGYVPLQFAFELALVGGGYTFVGLLWAVGVSLTGAFVLYRPDLSTVLGVLGVALSILSLLGALGGFLLGMLLGIVGGNLCIAWRPDDGDVSGNDPPGCGPAHRPGGGASDRPASGPGDDPDGGRAGEAETLVRPVADAAERKPSNAAGAAVVNAVDAAVNRTRAAVGDRLARRHSVTRGGSTGAEPPSRRRGASGPIADTGTRARLSTPPAVAVGLVVAASVALSVVATVPVAGIVGDDGSTQTVDVGEIRLGDDGRICAEAVGDDAYRVTITDARLHDVAVYRHRGGEAVRADLPTVEVADSLVLHTGGENDGIRRLAATEGCTGDGQDTRTVFRSHRQAGERLRAAEGVTMVNVRAVDGDVPPPGGFRFVAPATDEVASGVDGAGDEVAPGVADVAGDAEDQVDELEPTGGTVADVVDRAGNASGVTGSVIDDGGVVNDTDDVASVENATGNDSLADSVGNATGGEETGAAANETADAPRTPERSDETGSVAGAVENETADGTATRVAAGPRPRRPSRAGTASRRPADSPVADPAARR